MVFEVATYNFSSTAWPPNMEYGSGTKGLSPHDSVTSTNH
jgi:hypothetical protein